MKCPNKDCKNTKNFTILSESNTDNIDGLNHSHVLCNECGCQFNHWNEPVDKILSLLGKYYL